MVAVPVTGTEITLYGVFDGHNGSAVVQRLATQFLKDLADAFAETKPTDPYAVKDYLAEYFIQYDIELAYDKSLKGDSGSTATVAVVLPGSIVMAYVGDSPAMLMDAASGKVLGVIGKHVPTLEAENARIVGAGGTVETDEMGTPRVNGSLMISRAFGDFSLKFGDGARPPKERRTWEALAVTAKPDFHVWERPAKPALLVLMSDGMVETPSGEGQKTEEEVAKAIYEAYSGGAVDAEKMIQKLLDAHTAAAVAEDGGGPYDGDDLTLLIAALPGVPTGGGRRRRRATMRKRRSPKRRRTAARGKN